MGFKKTVCLVIWITCLSTRAEPVDEAKGAVKSGFVASHHLSESAGHSLIATGQLVSGVVAVPIMSACSVSTGVGVSATAIGTTSLKAMNSSPASPLPLTEETLTVLPPDRAMQQQPSRN